MGSDPGASSAFEGEPALVAYSPTSSLRSQRDGKVSDDDGSALDANVVSIDTIKNPQIQRQGNQMAVQMSPPGQVEEAAAPYAMGIMSNALPGAGGFDHGFPQQLTYMQHFQNYGQEPVSYHNAVLPPYGRTAGHGQAQHFYTSPPQMGHYYPPVNYALPPNQMGVHNRPNSGYYPVQGPSSPSPPGYYYPPPNQYYHYEYSLSHNHMMGVQELGHTGMQGLRGNSTDGGLVGELRNQGVSSAKEGSVRGPPRKPRQNGYALWVGNLPPQTDLMTLVKHIGKETTGLVSVFLISKSNCAFANFKDEETCATAQQKLHDSKFQSVRLVSRLRKHAVESNTDSAAQASPAASPSQTAILADKQNGNISHGNNPTVANTAPSAEATPKVAQAKQHPDRFFVLKSLTTEDLDLSVRTGTWATQSHNEEALGKAFASADSVYLIFSANKSGEYFGYARMASEINEDPAAAVEFAPNAASTVDADVPKAIPTEATAHVPRGQIIDDSARGTIFWEKEREEDEVGSEDESETASTNDGAAAEDPAKTRGKPFKLEWLSTSRLPFYRTRGLRNPWNSNREVKIARDGTELEPSVGRRLIGLFNRLHSPRGAHMPGGTMNLMHGYPVARPYG